MNDLIEMLESPAFIGPAAVRLLVAYECSLVVLRSVEPNRNDTAKVLAGLTAAITGNLSAVRRVHGAHVAEAMLRQVAADTGLDLARGRK